MTQDVQFLLNNTLAGSIAKKLDAQDGATDGKISASIWNAFVADKDGKTIKNSISIENAMKSITTYVVRKAEVGKRNEMAKGWLDAISGTVPPEPDKNLPAEGATPPAEGATPPAEGTTPPSEGATPPSEGTTPPAEGATPPAEGATPPAEGTTPPTVDDNPPKDTPVSCNIPGALTSSEMNRLNTKFAYPFPLDGGRIELDKNGYITAEYDKEGKMTCKIKRNDDGTVYSYNDYEYDANGKMTREIERSSDGTVWAYFDYEYDKEGKMTCAIERNDDGTVRYYYDYEYDKEGKMTRHIERWADGTVYRYYDYEYDKEGNKTRAIQRNPDGSEW
ncbi:MAG: hypothetical protein MJ237_03725 [bacterium]|nr:hypothetical protein [bacterium]